MKGMDMSDNTENTTAEYAPATVAKVAADIATVTTATAEVNTAVERYNTAKRDTTGAAITTPLAALAKVTAQDDHPAWSAVIDRLEGEDAEELAEMLAIASKLAGKLAVTLSTVNTADAVNAAERLVALAKFPYQLVPDAMMTEAGAAVAKWNTAFTAFKQASGQNVTRQTGRGGPRGLGKWREANGWSFAGTCPHCGNVTTGSSSPDSFAHFLAKHMGDEHRGGDKPYAGDAELDQCREAINRVIQGSETETTPQGWVISRVYAQAA